MAFYLPITEEKNLPPLTQVIGSQAHFRESVPSNGSFQSAVSKTTDSVIFVCHEIVCSKKHSFLLLRFINVISCISVPF